MKAWEVFGLLPGQHWGMSSSIVLNVSNSVMVTVYRKKVLTSKGKRFVYAYQVTGKQKSTFHTNSGAWRTKDMMIKNLKAIQKKVSEHMKNVPVFKKQDWFKEIATGKYEVALFTVNSLVSAKGNAVLGAGLAKAAHESAMKHRVNLKRIYGSKLSKMKVMKTGLTDKYKMTYTLHKAEVVALKELSNGTVLGTFPVKECYWEAARISIIKESCDQIVKIANKVGYKNILINFPGIGNGKLAKRYDEIKSILINKLDSRFTIVQKGE